LSQWSDPNYRAYRQQIRSSRYRNIEFNLTFDEWLTIWTESGHLSERGTGYVMARKGDRGAYAIGNIRITTRKDNNLEAFSLKTPEEVQRWKDGLNGHTPQANLKRGASVRKIRAEQYWSCSPKDPVERERWIENLRQSGTGIVRLRGPDGRYTK